MRSILATLALALTMLVAPTARADTLPPLTNLAHLDFLTASVAPSVQDRHTTYRLAEQPRIGMLWVYATHNDDGTYTRVGGGEYHPATDTYDQGAYDADDVARAAVVYVRHFEQFGDSHSRSKAVQLLRGLTYLQTASGPNAGNVVLWMQPDGTLNPSAFPVEQPDPSDSANSYWLARTIWALGEGYAAFRGQNRGFAAFLRDRMDLAIGALQRESFSRFGDHLTVDGVHTPAWLIVDGADASGEAVLGLSAFVTAGAEEGVRPLQQLADGIAALGSSAGDRWPYGAILPSALSRSTWHAWAGLAPAGLSAAARALAEPALAASAVTDSAAFDPRLLTSYGAINGLTPAPTDRSQIAYGVDSRVQSLLETARTAGRDDLRRLAGVFAGWYFGQNPAGVAMYDPSTGVTYDGVSADGVVNRNSGAESTIHGLLSMLALDADPLAAGYARASDEVVSRVGTRVVEGESAAASGPAAVVTADPPVTAESAWSNGGYLRVRGGATLTWTVPVSPRDRTLELVLDKRPGPGATVSFDGIGSVDTGSGAPQGASAVVGALRPFVIGTVPAGATTLVAHITGATGRLDALLLTPEVTSLRTTGTVVRAASNGAFTVRRTT